MPCGSRPASRRRDAGEMAVVRTRSLHRGALDPGIGPAANSGFAIGGDVGRGGGERRRGEAARERLRGDRVASGVSRRVAIAASQDGLDMVLTRWPPRSLGGSASAAPEQPSSKAQHAMPARNAYSKLGAPPLDSTRPYRTPDSIGASLCFKPAVWGATESQRAGQARNSPVQRNSRGTTCLLRRSLPSASPTGVARPDS
jgi:hypothetical protein